jgi:hypothetical protein
MPLAPCLAYKIGGMLALTMNDAAVRLLGLYDGLLLASFPASLPGGIGPELEGILGRGIVRRGQHLEALYKVIAPASGTIADVCRGERGACLQSSGSTSRPMTRRTSNSGWMSHGWPSPGRQERSST